MGKQYQTSSAEASTPKLTLPEEVSVALAEIAESATEGLLALAVGAGLQVLGTLMEESVTTLARPKGKHNPGRAAVRHGHEHGSVTLGGRRVAVQRPRVRAADGSGELPVAAYEFVLEHRDPGPAGVGADDARTVDPPLPDRARAGRRPGRTGLVGAQQV